MSAKTPLETPAERSDDATLLSLTLPAPVSVTSRLALTISDEFEGATVSNGPGSYVFRIPHTEANLALRDDDVPSRPARADVQPVGAGGDGFAVSLGTDAEVAGFLASSFRELLDRHAAANFVTMTVQDPASGQAYEVEVRRGGAVSAAERIAELEAEVARLVDESR